MRNTAQRAARDLQIAKLYLEGHSQQEIKRRLSILIPGHVAAAIRRMVIEWKAETIFNIGEAKAIELQRINKLEAETWSSFELSKRGAEVKCPTTGRTLGYARLPGDKGWLNIAKDCVRARCEILGLNAPEKIETAITTNEKFVSREEMSRRVSEKLAAMPGSRWNLALKQMAIDKAEAEDTGEEFEPQNHNGNGQNGHDHN